MKTKDELIYTSWGADEVDTDQRAVEILQTVSNFFPKVTYWTSSHDYDRGFEDKLEFDAPHNDDMSLVEGFDALDLWQKTVQHFNNLGLDSKFISVQYGFWSDALKSAYASLSNYSFGFENWDSEFEEERILPGTDVCELLAKQLGALPTLGNVWMLNHSAFAGDPIYLYEPRVPFSDYYSPVRYENVIDDVREARKQIRESIRANEITQMVKELGAEVESIGENRIFARFDKLGGDGGKTILPQLEQQISNRLEKNFKTVG